MKSNDMKKKLMTAGLFLLVFVGTYLALSFAVPGLRNPAITNTEHFYAESLLYHGWVKSMASFVVGVFLAYGPRLMETMAEEPAEKKAKKNGKKKKSGKKSRKHK